MKVIVADTSALIRLYLPDGPIPDGFEDYVDSAWRAEATLVVPELALPEVAQVLWKKQQSDYISESEADEILSAVLDLPIEVVGHRELLVEAIAFARLHSLTVYDSLFLALARKMKAELITADEKLKRAFQVSTEAEISR